MRELDDDRRYAVRSDAKASRETLAQGERAVGSRRRAASRPGLRRGFEAKPGLPLNSDACLLIRVAHTFLGHSRRIRHIVRNADNVRSAGGVRNTDKLPVAHAIAAAVAAPITLGRRCRRVRLPTGRGHHEGAPPPSPRPVGPIAIAPATVEPRRRSPVVPTSLAPSASAATHCPNTGQIDLVHLCGRPLHAAASILSELRTKRPSQCGPPVLATNTVLGLSATLVRVVGRSRTAGTRPSSARASVTHVLELKCPARGANRPSGAADLVRSYSIAQIEPSTAAPP